MVLAETVLLYSSLMLNMIYSYPRLKKYYKNFTENKNNYLIYNGTT